MRATPRLSLALLGLGYFLGLLHTTTRAQTVPAVVIQRAVAPAGGAPAATTVQELPANVFAEKPGTTRPLSATASNTAESKKAQRLQKIQQLTFDRRPSTILKTWANPDGEIVDEPVTPGGMVPIVTRALPSAASVSSLASTASSTPDPFDAELKTFRRQVTLGDWPGVKTFLAKLPEDEGKALYQRLIQNLPSPVSAVGRMPAMEAGGMMMVGGMMQPMPQISAFLEKNAISAADVIALAGASPKPLEASGLNDLGRLLRAAIDQGSAIEDLVRSVQNTLKDQDRVTGFPLTRREVAKVLFAANAAVEAGAFLPTAKVAEAGGDREALNLLSRHYLALYAKDRKSAHLEDAWSVTQAVLTGGKAERKEREEALTRAVELAVKLRDELGKAWLAESFTKQPERGMEIIAAIGAASSKGIQTSPNDPEFRKRSLELQKTAVEALIQASPDRAKGWSDRLGLLADAWITEAEFSQKYDYSTSLGPRMSRDAFGNFYYLNDPSGQPNMPRNPNIPQAVRVSDVLESRPGETWLALLDPATRPRFASVCSQLYLKVGEDVLAFPYVRQLASTHREKARELAEEFVRVWTRNHDPNSERNRTNPYIYMFGFERKAESIPLTRSKQERNLKELAEWVRQIRELKLGDLDESLLARAFTTCHSAAEVYRVEAIQSVFGSLDALKPETLAELAQQMRSNLLGAWRQPALQEQNKTKRKEKDIRAEVLRGYEVARATIESGLKRYPDHWGLEVARAAVLHDENNYRQELDPSLQFTKQRGAALDLFRAAAGRYAKVVPTLAEEKETTQPFEQWFYASLGACDLNAIDEKALPDLNQPALIRQAILALPGPAAERHMARFANALFTRMSGLNPAVKFRYLRGGFEIVGDHPRAHEAKKVYDYYKDLVTEIKLETQVDGATSVGQDKPFGLFVNLRHTREIERESGGFGRYLQNQNATGMFSYNYGRPLENYRDKFQDAATKALQDHFQVLSVTFQDDKVNSKATAEYGWRVTPYAYVLLKSKSPEVDKIPPLRIDLDFLDTSGYVILPVESPIVPIDSSRTSPPARPFTDLQITQTLDERQAEDGRLVLEVKAVAKGLVPSLEEIMRVESPGFEVVKTDDQGLAVSKFDPEGSETAVISERSWLVTLQAPPSEQPPTSFTFAKPHAAGEGAAITYQRYVDADLAQVQSVVELEERYGEAGWFSRKFWIGAGGLSLLAAAGAWWRLRPRSAVAEDERYTLPEPLTPFTVLGLLRDIQQNNGLDEPKKRELAASIDRLERHFFAETSGDAPDLRAIATTWVSRTA